MSLFGGLFGGGGKRIVPAFTLARTRGFQQQVVGEARYQSALTKIVGGKGEFSAKHQCVALLVCVENNPHDKNAVEVLIDGRLVGFLPKEDAKIFRDDLLLIDHRLPVTAVVAKIVGGWRNEESEGDFGVKLNLKWPVAKAKG